MSDPVRSCVGCRERVAAATLLRVAWDDTQQRVVWDVRRRLGGRGAWLHPRPDCLEWALRRRAFGRALRRTVTSAETAGLADGLAGAASGPSRGMHWPDRRPNP